MSDAFSATSCTIEVYPFEGGQWTLTPGTIRRVTVEKSLHGNAVGRAEIQLAPGGPDGPESEPDWSQIITPMSHVLIGMSRGARAAIVMDGVTTHSVQLQEWQTSEQGSSAGRFPSLEVNDIAWFFQLFNWYALTFFGVTAETAVGNAMGFAPASVPQAISQGLLGGSTPNPAHVASQWFDKIMAGQGAILGKTYLPYQGAQLPFSQLITTLWENLPNVYVPFSTFFAAEVTWLQKFQAMLPMPWYEFFVTTAPEGVYPMPQGSSGDTANGALFSMLSQPLAAPAGPHLVARVNPVPTFRLTSHGPSQPADIGQLDMNRWNAMLLDSPDFGFYESNIDFGVENVTNFYMLNPTAMQTLFGNNNANSIPFPFTFIGAADTASIHRYGYHPYVGTFQWLWDAQGLAGQGHSINMPETVAFLLGSAISWFHPLPLMARAAVSLPLMPNVYIGTRFRYAPFKDGFPWDFYVEGVRHEYVFGGHSSTTLTLTRGLPAAVYADSGGVLRDIHLGNAMRYQGVYQSGLPPGSTPALQTFGLPGNVTELVGNMAQIFVTPQPAHVP